MQLSGTGWRLRGPSCSRLQNVEQESERRGAERLLEVFGMEDPPPPPAHFKQPPQYMVDLFNTVANADGVTKNPDILEGNTVRSFLDKTHGEKMRFLFVLSSVAKNEKILTAELHLFRLWPRATDGPKRHHFCQVSVYQVLEKSEPDAPEGKKLLAARLVSLQGSGWEVFAITQAVRDWTEDESSNRGLLVMVQGLGGSPLDPPPLQFASSRDHHESKKPMLVLFTDDGRRGASLPVAGFPGGSHMPFPAKMSVPKLIGPRSTRSLDRLQPCQRHPLSVDFEEIGWSGQRGPVRNIEHGHNTVMGMIHPSKQPELAVAPVQQQIPLCPCKTLL
ncbi:PREDICTED: bone morphogenetic protein 2-like [Cariama cristata]|uniref:bone morphogenetic protein 2-like n=1 Tax=Cariama cristata TaxID=54380 RepID=UPI000520CF14|nr:PREDICTED: bone morphogenetic protein 2-like [Cariama cristata]